MTVLPGGGSGRDSVLGVAKAALRLLGAEAVADSIADLLGVGSRVNVVKFARESLERLEDEGGHEFRDVAEADRDNAEDIVVEILERAAKRQSLEARQRLQSKAVTSTSALVGFLLDSTAEAPWRQLPDDAQAYFSRLLRLVAAAIREWYATEPKARASAGVAAQGALLREVDVIAGQLQTMEEANARRHFEVLGAIKDAWTPAFGQAAGEGSSSRPIDRKLLTSISQSAAAVYTDPHSSTPIGVATLIDERRLITAASVVKALAADQIWIDFPRSGNPFSARLPVQDVRCSNLEEADLAIIQLGAPAPTEVRSALLRRPTQEDLIGRQWHSFGFPKSYPIGDVITGAFGSPTSFGLVRLTIDGQHDMREGFNGGGIWAEDYGALVAIIVHANGLNASQAITINAAIEAMPEENLSRLASWSILSNTKSDPGVWEWSLQNDTESLRHWNPRSRGVTVEAEQGFRFRGRTRALSEIVEWLERPLIDNRVLVIAGQPGVGKSAVLARIVTTADPRLASQLPAEDMAVRAPIASVGCAIHARGRSALEVAQEVAKAASAELPSRPDDLALVLRRTMRKRRSGQRFNIVIDALDEAVSPEEARSIALNVVLPLVQTCADIGIQVVVGSRYADTVGPLIRPTFGRAATIIDLDDEQYSSLQDLEQYALATLQLLGSEREDNPYNDLASAGPVAKRIAFLASGNFLIAGLLARAHALYDATPVDPDEIAFDSSIENAFRLYMDRIPDFRGVSAEELLLPLAYAQSPGMPESLWSISLQTLTNRAISADDLSEFAHTAGASFIVIEAAEESGSTVFRLFHQGLSETLQHDRTDRGKSKDKVILARRFIEIGRSANWVETDPYLARSAAAHAAEAGIFDEVVLDSEYVLNGDISALLRARSLGESPSAMDRMRAIRLSPEAATSGPARRAAALSITSVLEGMPRETVPGFSGIVPYFALWGRTIPSAEIGNLKGSEAPISSMCMMRIEDRELLAASDADSVLRVWDTLSGIQFRSMECDIGPISAMCSISYGDNEMLILASSFDQTLRICDPTTGEQVHAFGEVGRYRTTCIASCEIDGRLTVITGADDGRVRVWDPHTGKVIVLISSNRRPVTAISVLMSAASLKLMVAYEDDTLSVFDPATGAEKYSERQRLGGLSALAGRAGSKSLAGEVFVAGSSTRLAMVSLGDRSRTEVASTHTGSITALTLAGREGDEVLASASSDGTVAIWDQGPLRQRQIFRGHTRPITALAAINDGLPLVASSDRSGLIRLWDVHRGADDLDYDPMIVPDNLQIATDGERTLIVGVSAGRVHILEIASGMERYHPRQPSPVRLFCLCGINRQMLAMASNDVIRVSDLYRGRTLDQFSAHSTAMAPVTLNGRAMLALARTRPENMKGDEKSVWLDFYDLGRKKTLFSLQLLSSNSVVRIFQIFQNRSLLGTFDGRNVSVWSPISASDRSLKVRFYFPNVDAYCLISPVIANHSVQCIVFAQRGRLTLWNAERGELIRELSAYDQPVRTMCAIELDGCIYLAVGGDDQVVCIWDLERDALVQSIPLHRRIDEVISHAEGSLTVRVSDGLLQLSLNYRVAEMETTRV